MKPIPENNMYRSTVLNHSAASTHPHSKLGIVSCACSVLAWLLLVVLALKLEWVFILGWSNGMLALIFYVGLSGNVVGFDVFVSVAG